MAEKIETPAPPWVKQVAMLTGVLAALAGFLTVRSTALSNDMLYQNNQAVLAQTQAADLWTEFQANSIKARMVETELKSSDSLSAADKAELTKYDLDVRQRQPILQKEATDKEADCKWRLALSDQRVKEKNLLGYGSMCVQLGIALASVAALTRRKIAFHAGILAGAGAVIITAYALISAHLLST